MNETTTTHAPNGRRQVGWNGTPEERFLRKCGEPTESGCIPWLGAKSQDGYGRFWFEGRMVPAYRFAYESTIGAFPEGLESDHLCRNRACVNAEHIEPVTHETNMRRGTSGESSRARAMLRTHCKNGHAYDEANTYIKQGWRFCRACNREHVRESRLLRKVAVA